MDERFIYAGGLTLSAGLLALGGWIVFRRRLGPAEKERRRRQAINRSRRTVEGFITEADAGIIHYQYELSGVTYFASQELDALAAFLPGDPARLIGPVSVKYDPRNPANSILLCEEWSGLPARAVQAGEPA